MWESDFCFIIPNKFDLLGILTSQGTRFHRWQAVNGAGAGFAFLPEVIRVSHLVLRASLEKELIPPSHICTWDES